MSPPQVVRLLLVVEGDPFTVSDPCRVSPVRTDHALASTLHQPLLAQSTPPEQQCELHELSSVPTQEAASSNAAYGEPAPVSYAGVYGPVSYASAYGPVRVEDKPGSLSSYGEALTQTAALHRDPAARD